MFPSGQAGTGINSSFGLVPISGHSSSSSSDGARNLAFNWLGHLTGRGVGLFDEPTTGLKSSSDQIMDRSFMSIDRHTPTVPRRTPHSSVGGSSGQSGAEATQPQHQIPDPSMVKTFHPYRLVGDSLPGTGHPSLSTSQFAAFDSLYKAYQGAYGSSAPGSVFGTQPFRFDNPLLADQRMMLQASLLQYPHLGIFPNAALYPGLPGTGVRYPNDYYGQNLSGMSLSSKYPEVGGPTWLGFDRSMALLDREKDAKDGDRKSDLDLSKRSDKDESHRSRPERDEMLSLRRESKDDGRRCEDGRRDAMKHSGEKKDLQKRSSSLKSPIRQEGHHSSMQDGSLNRCNSGGPNDFSNNSVRGGHVGTTFGMSADLSGMAKVSSSPGGITSQQRQTASRSDRTIDSAQDHVRSKDRHHHHNHHHHHHHHGWKPEDAKNKATPLVLTVPKTSASTNGQQSKPFEKKFHRPFEQSQMNSGPAEKPERFPAHGPRDTSAKNSHSRGSSLDYVARGSDAKSGDGSRMLQQQQLRGAEKLFEPKSQPLSASSKKHGRGGMARCEEAPLNLVVTKSQNSGTVVPTNPVGVEPLSCDEFEFPRIHHATATQPLVVPPISGSELGFLGPAWGLVSSDDGHLLPRKSAEGISGGLATPTVAPPPNKASPPVSKLDLEAKRRAQMRKNESYNSEDEEDDEEDEDLLDNSKDLARLLLISSGPPLKQPVTVAKSNFLSMFGLVSSDSCKELAFERSQKRHRLFCERSVSPIVIDESGEPELSAKKPCFRNEIAHLDKHSFLGLLNLETTRQHPKRRKVASQSDHNEMNECYREPLASLSTNSDVVGALLDQKQRAESGHSREDCLQDPGFEVLPESRPYMGSSSSPFPGGNSGQRWPSVEADGQSSCELKLRPDGHLPVVRAQDDHRQIGGRFSLLNSAADGRLAKESALESSPFNVSSRNASTPSSAAVREVTNGQAPPTSTDLQCRDTTFHWPGLEAIIESYHHYVEEQTMEKQLLREQSQRLRHHNAQLVFTAEHHRTRVSELLHSKQQLIEERLRTQSLVDGLKDTLKQLI